MSQERWLKFVEAGFVSEDGTMINPQLWLVAAYEESKVRAKVNGIQYFDSAQVLYPAPTGRKPSVEYHVQAGTIVVYIDPSTLESYDAWFSRWSRARSVKGIHTEHKIFPDDQVTFLTYTDTGRLSVNWERGTAYTLTTV